MLQQYELGIKREGRILAMAKVLLKNYEVFMGEDDQMHGIANIINKNTGQQQNIHWYEFCITLVCELQSSMPKNKVFRDIPPYVNNIFPSVYPGCKWTFVTEFFFHLPKMNGHPIDYLWDEFKKHF